MPRICMERAPHCKSIGKDTTVRSQNMRNISMSARSPTHQITRRSMSLLPSAVAIANQAMLPAEMATLYGMLTIREDKPSPTERVLTSGNPNSMAATRAGYILSCSAPNPVLSCWSNTAPSGLSEVPRILLASVCVLARRGSRATAALRPCPRPRR